MAQAFASGAKSSFIYEMLTGHPFFWVISQVGILKVWNDYRFDLNVYKYTRKVEYEKTSQRTSYINAKSLTDELLNHRSSWDIQDGESSANTHHCTTRLYSVLSQLSSSERNDAVPSKVLLEELYSLPHELSFVKYCLTKDLSRRLVMYRARDENPALCVTNYLDNTDSVRNDFLLAAFGRKIENVKDKDKEDIIRGVIVSNRELCKSVLMGYLASSGVFVWLRAYLRYDTMVAQFFKSS